MRCPGEPLGAGARGQDGRGRTESYPEDLRGHSPKPEGLRDKKAEPCSPLLSLSMLLTGGCDQKAGLESGVSSSVPVRGARLA